MQSEEARDQQSRIEHFNHQLLASEDQYVNVLETIVEYIVKPLEKAAVRCKIQGGEQEVKKVFQYLISMRDFHITFLSIIRETISIIPDLNDYINFIQMYDDYLRHYDQIVAIFATWRSMEFREFVSLRLKHQNVRKHIIDKLDSLPWYLYRPFDRIKEYHRFLKDVEKISRKGHGDYNLVRDSLKKIRPLYRKIKSSEKRLQNKTRLLEVQLQIHGYHKERGLVEDGRRFVYNRQCQMKRDRGLISKRYKHIQIYLFNDLFLWVSARGKFKGSYSFLADDLEIGVPADCKKGDALFSIGLHKERHKRLIVCADDAQRDKTLNTVLRTYRQCQEQKRAIELGTDQSAIHRLKKKQVRETNVKDVDISFTPSLSTQNLREEYSVEDSSNDNNGDSGFMSPLHKQQHSNSISGGGDESHSRNTLSHSRGGQSHSQLPQIKETAEYRPDAKSSREHRESVGGHLVGPNGNGTAESSPSLSPVQNVEISLHGGVSREEDIKNGASQNPGITPHHSSDCIESDIRAQNAHKSSLESASSMRSDPTEHALPNGGGAAVAHSRAWNGRERKRKHHRRREHIKELQELVADLQQQLTMKDERINDLIQSNTAVRHTVAMKDQAIGRMKEEIEDLKQRLRMKSMVNQNAIRAPQRAQRAASFSIGKGGKIQRTVRVPEGVNKLSNGTSSIKLNVTLNTPTVPAIRRSASENIVTAPRHRKTKSSHIKAPKPVSPKMATNLKYTVLGTYNGPRS